MAPAVVLRSASDSHAPNNYLAKSLVDLIGNPDFSHAVIIEGLKIKTDINSDYGLSFEKGENFRVIEAPAFDYTNHQRHFTRINPDYTIDFCNEDENQRILFTRGKGVSGLSLGRDLLVYLGAGDLAYSDGGGQVVVVSAEGTKSQKN